MFKNAVHVKVMFTFLYDLMFILDWLNNLDRKEMLDTKYTVKNLDAGENWRFMKLITTIKIGNAIKRSELLRADFWTDVFSEVSL